MSKIHTVKDETLFENKWMTVKQKTMSNGAKWVYSSAPWSGSVGVAVLPYKVVPVFDLEMNHVSYDMAFLGRFDVIPCHSDEIELNSITGGYDNSDKYSLAECALNELAEEGGFKAEERHLIYLGSIRPNKSSDYITHLFAIDVELEDVEKCEAISDGSLGEQGAYSDWVYEEDIVDSKDPILHALMLRLVHHIEEAIFLNKEQNKEE